LEGAASWRWMSAVGFGELGSCAATASSPGAFGVLWGVWMQPRCVWGPLGSLDAAQVRLGSFGESGCSPGAFGVLWGVWIEFKVVKSRAHH
jgi:hypothetical protein